MCACVNLNVSYPQLEVTEKNPGGYLSAAEIPLSRLYIGMAGVFFTAAMIWVYTLMKHRYTCIQVHWHGCLQCCVAVCCSPSYLKVNMQSSSSEKNKNWKCIRGIVSLSCLSGLPSVHCLQCHVLHILLSCCNIHIITRGRAFRQAGRTVSCACIWV